MCVSSSLRGFAAVAPSNKCHHILNSVYIRVCVCETDGDRETTHWWDESITVETAWSQVIARLSSCLSFRLCVFEGFHPCFPPFSQSLDASSHLLPFFRATFNWCSNSEDVNSLGTHWDRASTPGPTVQHGGGGMVIWGCLYLDQGSFSIRQVQFNTW